MNAVAEHPATEEQAAYAAAGKEEFAREDCATPDNAQAISAVLTGEFSNAKNMRRDTELRWLRDARQYRGKYTAEEEKKMGSRSKVFVRKTRVKIKTIDSRVSDLLFPAGSEKNWSIEPTPKPMISDEQRDMIITQVMQAAQQVIAQAQQAAQQGQPMAAPGQPAGGAPAPTEVPPPPNDDQIASIINDFVKDAAKKMSTTIEDQLTESRYKETCVRVVHSGHLYGTGILKGPLVERKISTRHVKVAEPIKDPAGNVVVDEGGRPKLQMRWVAKTTYTIVPFMEHVPVWRFYPDMSATELEDCEFVWEQHFFNRARMMELAKRKSFDGAKIKAFVAANPQGSRSTPEHYDSELRTIGDRFYADLQKNNVYEVLERWGWLSGKQLREAGYTVSDERLEEAFFSNVWMLHNGEIIKVALQPIDGTTWPYHLYSFDKDETSLFAEGLSSVMRDDQAMLNASIRLMLDNAAISSGPQLEVITSLLVDKENINDVFPWKIWKRNNEQPNVHAVRAIDLPNNVDMLTKMAALFEQNADEVTAIPRYMSGENATQGAAGTAAGMSMLMAAANIVIKDLITAWDEGITRPFLQALYHWNMKFNPDDSIKGDFDVKARGTASLIAKEVRARQLNDFAAQTNNPLDAPYIKRHDMLLQRAEANEMSGVVMTKEEFEQAQQSPGAQQQQQLQQAMQQAQLGELQAKVAKMNADAELANARAKDAAERLGLIAIEAKQMLANIEKTMGETVRVAVESIYAAFQAGGAATATPFVAPAGDEIYRSAGGVDKTPKVPLNDVNREPVQESAGTTQVLNKGQSFAVQPRALPNGQQAGTDEAPEVDQPNTTPPQGNAAPDLQPQTGMVGKGAGIETARIEGAQQ